MFFEQSNTLAGSDNTFDGLGGDMETMGLIDYGSSGGINWNNIINQAFGIGSQAIAAFSGKNTGTQIGYNPASQSVFAIQPNQSPRFDDTPTYYAQGQQPAGYGPQGVGGTVGSGVDGIFNWLMSNPLITFGGIAALFLLFREPPRRR
jgi:hypothetical protein